MNREEDEYNEWKTVEKVVQIGDWKVVFGYQGPNKDPVVERGKGNDGKSEDGRYMEDLDRLHRRLVERGKIKGGFDEFLEWVRRTPGWREGVRREREREREG